MASVGTRARSRYSFRKITTVFVLLPILIGGCSIHPLPKDVVPLDTKAIVRKIRCEARDALQVQLKELLEKDKSATEANIRKYVNYIYSDIRNLARLKNDGFSKETIFYINKYQFYLIYMDFTFTIYEENNVSTDINLLSTLTIGSNGVGLKASNGRKRQSLRNFRVRNTFFDLLHYADCEGRSEGADYLYPITGEIGLLEVIDTFLDLNETKALAPKPPSENVQLFADTLSFTTSFSGTVSPKVVLSPVGKPLSLADASLTTTSTRSDLHEVLIGMALPDKTTTRNNAPSPQLPPSLIEVPSSSPDQYTGGQLDFFMDQQIRRNLILSLTGPRAAVMNIIP